jgi:hypothetical protein
MANSPSWKPGKGILTENVWADDDTGQYLTEYGGQLELLEEQVAAARREQDHRDLDNEYGHGVDYRSFYPGRGGKNQQGHQKKQGCECHFFG